MATPAHTLISRVDARSQGLALFFTGHACEHGHVAPRVTSSNSCIECARERNRRWYARNVVSERKRGRIKRAENAERYQVYSIEYNSKNLPRLAVIARNRRARQKKNGGSHTIEDIASILKLQRSKCAYCRIMLGTKYHVDHIVALAKGGSNDRRNLQILCVACNKSKSARDPIEFMQSKGLLL